MLQILNRLLKDQNLLFFALPVSKLHFPVPGPQAKCSMCRLVQSLRRIDELMRAEHKPRVLQGRSNRNRGVFVPFPHTNSVVIYSEEYLIYN